jgi:hypothetical protein
LLAEIAKQIAPRRHAALILDRASWHLSGRLAPAPNITIARLRRNALSPIQLKTPSNFMRVNWLSNRIFKSLPRNSRSLLLRLEYAPLSAMKVPFNENDPSLRRYNLVYFWTKIYACSWNPPTP